MIEVIVVFLFLRPEFCLFVKTTEDFNKDYTLSFDSDIMRDDWIKAIAAAKENKPMPDSINRAFVMKNDDNYVEDNKDYFNKLLTAFNEHYRSNAFQDIILRLSSFFSRVAFSVSFFPPSHPQDIMGCEELLSSCEQVCKMVDRVRVEMQRTNLMTQDIEYLFNDLHFCIKYCIKYTQQYTLCSALMPRKQARMVHYNTSSESSASASPVSVMSSEQESRGTVQHGFFNRFVLVMSEDDV